MNPVLFLRQGNYMSGPAVHRFQEFGELLLGEDFLENDGFFGKETEALAKKVQEKLGIDADGVVGEQTWNKLFEAIGRTVSGAKVYQVSGVTVKDCRLVFGAPAGFFGKDRSPQKIHGVVIHQTGCWMSNDESTWERTRCHCGITRSGDVLLTHPFDWGIGHAQDLSGPAIGIEIAGNFPGLIGKNYTWWKSGGGPHEFTEAQEKACDVLFGIIKEEFERMGVVWTKVYAHRQSSDQRESDPGEEIWKKVALKWQKDLGADDGGPEYCVGSGKPIPKEWNESYTSRFR